VRACATSPFWIGKRKIVKKTDLPDTLSDIASARTGIGALGEPTPDDVRKAQLQLAATALEHKRLGCPEEREAELEEVLRALGIFNRIGKISMRPARVSRAYNNPV
jgi:hypothetical protein